MFIDFCLINGVVNNHSLNKILCDTELSCERLSVCFRLGLEKLKYVRATFLVLLVGNLFANFPFTLEAAIYVVFGDHSY